MSKEEIANLSLQDYDKLKQQRMEFNAWEVAKEITNPIDGAPVLSEYIPALTAEPISNQYFLNKEELVKYVAASEAPKASLPGSAYICKIFTFMKTHYQFGKVYIT